MIHLAREVELRVHHLALDAIGVHGFEARLRIEVARVPRGFEVDEVFELQRLTRLQPRALLVVAGHAGVPVVVELRCEVLLHLVGRDHTVRVGGEEAAGLGHDRSPWVGSGDGRDLAPT